MRERKGGKATRTEEEREGDARERYKWKAGRVTNSKEKMGRERAERRKMKN